LPGYAPAVEISNIEAEFRAVFHMIRFVMVKMFECVAYPKRDTENTTIKNEFNTKPEGSRKVRRSRLKWEEYV
jgi:hypothetical protein